MVKRTLDGMLLAGEPLMQEAINALRLYHETKDSGAPAAEVERLRQLAASAFQAVTDYQLYALGHQPLTRH